TVGVITNVGTAHIEHLGSREEIALEKGDLVARLPSDGTAVLNADDPLVMGQRERTNARVLSFGTSESADVR
ncbi:MAG: UDP-N-acetylmuramoyl-tripeptide--D-alanyl-D-alanine ligase, partial [Gammaproteobacteria bacterium]|nr:UDP-N-acetylmuramoyl-tripeptide--D-alanyl-D-alanine ligase [Gammaproteobacteria bacterium]NIQ26338.1 UDP-N-acetylmuramoyl-tripeptide--D-alanyl-D-alanine ligase [Gammaproteobacteria bacterium]NIT93878.1 UDP-N-acetylmuramoyl-tripeptide--D-alanyl-D-alanine ligase [Gammaproteobacteria bacterium]